MIVVDASVLANVIGDDGPDGQLARREVRAAAGDLAAPDLVDPETVAVLAAAAKTIARQFGFGVPADDGGDLADCDLSRR